MNILNDVRERLGDAGVVGGVTGWRYFIGYTPTTPDLVVVGLETGGREPDSQGGQIHYPTFQVKVRAAKGDYRAARAKMMECYSALHNQALYDHDLSPPQQYTYCYAEHSGPIPLGRDENERVILVMNFKCMTAR